MAEPTLYGLDDFRAALEAAGWRIARNNLGAGQWNECNWYAWWRDDITPDCASNEKAPSLCVWPYASRIDGRQHTGATLEICGRAGADDWLKLQVYTLTPAEFFDRYAVARDRLAAAWKAAAEV